MWAIEKLADFTDRKTQRVDLQEICHHHEAFVSLVRQLVLLFPEGIQQLVCSKNEQNLILGSAICQHYNCDWSFVDSLSSPARNGDSPKPFLLLESEPLLPDQWELLTKSPFLSSPFFKGYITLTSHVQDPRVISLF